MTPQAGSQKRFNERAELQTSDDVLKRIRKLRWIGMEAEARALELGSPNLAPINPVLTDRLDTD
ncbi:hypothetical protein [Microbaculum sp. FT89]|uniref:hypothetical protein n=1 Tax=Microbaculum sp. FT89 TaxID=3447298 RepID=UPI003F536DCA